jgi:hypothetical protein
MWMTVLAMKTITAESRIGSHSDAMVIIGLPSLFLLVLARGAGRGPHRNPEALIGLYPESGSQLIVDRT